MIEHANISKTDERRQAILAAAFDTFAAYGFKRTSMDDIAKAAGMSRPALYQSFANKNDIFRALVNDSLDQATETMTTELTKDQPIDIMLDQLFDASVLNPHRMMEAMPHGQELLGLKDSVAPDLFAEWITRSHQAYEQALLQDKSLDPKLASDLAKMIADAISGMKSRHDSVSQIEIGLASIKRVVASAVAR